MMNRICLLLAIVFAPQVAHAECWTGESVHAFIFLRNATHSDIEDCLSSGVDPNEPEEEGHPALFTLAYIGLDNADVISIIQTLMQAGADPNVTPSGYKHFVNAIWEAERRWGADSPVTLALQGTASSHTATATTPLYGAIAVAELKYAEEGQRYKTPSVIAYNSASIDRAIERATSRCNRSFALARAYDDYNECIVYQVFSTSFRVAGYHDSDGDGSADTRKTPGRCGVAMSSTIHYQDGSYKPFWMTGVGNSRATAVNSAMAHCRDNWGRSPCDALTVKTFACSDR